MGALPPQALLAGLSRKTRPRLHRIVAAQPYPLLFATISGAHLYGFPSPDSDFDLRGAHVLPLEKVVGLEVRDETVQDSSVIEGLEMDIVSHDVKKSFGLLLKKNGYVLEQLFSPLIVQTTPEHEELKEICSPRQSSGRGNEAHTAAEGKSLSLLTSAATGVVTKHHAHHYFGFAETQWKLFLKESPRRVKPLLYVYRVLHTGIHLMRSGVVEANLLTLNEAFKLPYVAGLIDQKVRGENTALADADVAFHEAEYQGLRIELQAAHDASSLPELPDETTRAALNDLLVRVRLPSDVGLVQADTFDRSGAGFHSRASQSGGGPPHSKDAPRTRWAWLSRQRLGVRQLPGAFRRLSILWSAIRLNQSESGNTHSEIRYVPGFLRLRD